MNDWFFQKRKGGKSWFDWFFIGITAVCILGFFVQAALLVWAGFLAVDVVKQVDDKGIKTVIERLWCGQQGCK